MQYTVGNRIIEEDPMKILADIQAECNTGKLSKFHESGSGIAVICPRHAGGQENRPSCYINLTSNTAPYLWVHCFTCGLNEPFEVFVAECFNKSIEWASNWLISKYATDYVRQTVELESIKLDKEPEKEHFLDESILDTFESYHPYMTQRHLTDEVIKRFKIKYDPQTRCIVFPVYDINGKLKFLTRRSVIGKKFIIDKDANKKDVYLLNEVIKDKATKVVVVESQINALTLWGWGIPAVALLGAGTTQEQMNELNKTDVLTWVLAYDNDEAGKKGAAKFKKMIKSTCFVDVVTVPEGKDVNDLTKEEWESLNDLL